LATLARIAQQGRGRAGPAGGTLGQSSRIAPGVPDCPQDRPAPDPAGTGVHPAESSHRGGARC